MRNTSIRVLLIGGSGFIGPHVARALERLGHEVVIFHRGTGRTHGSAPTRGAPIEPNAGADPGVGPNVGANPRVGPGAGADPRVGPGVGANPRVGPGVGADPRVGPNAIIGDRRKLEDSATALRALAPDVVVDLILSSGTQARTLMQVFRGATSRVVALSSCDVYRACGVLHGSEPGPLQPLPLTESSDLRTNLQTYPPDRVKMLQQVFGWLDEEYDKIPVEREILGEPELPGTVLRLPMVYGPGDPLRRFLPIVKRVDDRRQVILFEDKYARWRGPRGYVENVAAAIALAATSDRAAGRIYNVGETESLTELEWAERIAPAAGWNGRFVTLPAEQMPAHLVMPGNMDQHWTIDTTRIREELGYREPVAQADAIRRTIEWERANPTESNPHAFDYEAEDATLRACATSK